MTGTLGDLLHSIPSPFSPAGRFDPTARPALPPGDRDLRPTTSPTQPGISRCSSTPRRTPSPSRRPSGAGARWPEQRGRSTPRSDSFLVDRPSDHQSGRKCRRSEFARLPPPADPCPRPRSILDPGIVVRRGRNLFSQPPRIDLLRRPDRGAWAGFRAAQEKMRGRCKAASDLGRAGGGRHPQMLESLLGDLGFTSVTVTFVPSPTFAHRR